MQKQILNIHGLGIYDASVAFKNKNVTPTRTVSLYEIEYVLEDGGISYINNESYPIRKGSVIVAKPGYIRHTVLPFKSLFVHLIIEDEEICEMLDKCPAYFEPERPYMYEEALRAIIAESTSDQPYKNIKVYDKLFSLFSILISNVQVYTFRDSNARSNIEVVKNAIEYMDERFCEDIDLEDVSRHVHLSRIYFRSVFVAATGMTPYRYIRNKRLSLAKQLILTTDKTFSNIAVACGFSSQSYMNSVFREEFDKTPKQFREETSLMYQTTISRK